MSKFTTQVRFICESYAGLPESVGFNDIDDVVAEARTSIFKSYPIFDEAYRPTLEGNILRHYYTREISEEVVGLWLLRLNNRMNEIMPKYNKLYESALIEFDPLNDTDIKTQHNKNNSSAGTSNSESEYSKSDTRNVENEDSGVSNVSKSSELNSDSSNSARSNINASAQSTDSKSQKDKYSDTPQGGINGLESGTYLTNARIIDGVDRSNQQNSQDSTSEGSGNVHDTSKENNTEISSNTSKTNDIYSSSANDKRSDASSINSTEAYIEHIIGKRGVTSYSKMIMEYRETFLNIDRMIIDELGDLFFGLWE